MPEVYFSTFFPISKNSEPIYDFVHMCGMKQEEKDILLTSDGTADVFLMLLSFLGQLQQRFF